MFHLTLKSTFVCTRVKTVENNNWYFGLLYFIYKYNHSSANGTVFVSSLCKVSLEMLNYRMDDIAFEQKPEVI